MGRISLYKIEGFESPKYNFRISLLDSFVKIISKKELSKDFYENIIEEGKYLIKQNFSAPLIPNYEPYIFSKNEKGNLTYLLNSVRIPKIRKEAPVLDIYYNFDLKISNSEEYIDYFSHNIDNWMQASTLLLLWLKWISNVNLELKHKQGDLIIKI
ncbi:MAG: hypothetical protein ABIH65_00190 [Nanoarchaeota archaeon]